MIPAGLEIAIRRKCKFNDGAVFSEGVVDVGSEPKEMV
jgi:hypothetical protein